MVALKSSLIALASLCALVSSAPSHVVVRDSSINEPAVSSDGGTPVPIESPSVDVNNSNSCSSSDCSSESSSSSNSNSYGSSSSNGYGSSSSNSYGSGSSNSYGSSNNNYGSGNSYQSSSSSMIETSTMMSETTSTMMSESTSTMMESSTSVMIESSTMTAEATSTPMYGSGSSNWGNSGYNDCVQQCVASYGAPPPSMYTPPPPPPSNNYGNSGNSGSGNTWTVIVAPQQGVLRFVPFAVNASVGDTVRFVWHANVHTVTKSSVLEPCNKTSDAPFSSGIQNQSFVFDQKVNDTNPTFFYCGVPGHCPKGMYGIINPPNAAGSPSAAGAMMAQAAMNNSDLSAQMTYTQSQTGASNTSSWGMYMDMSSMMNAGWTNDMTTSFYQNIMYTQLAMTANPGSLVNGVLSYSGDATGASAAPLAVPQDITKVTASNTTASSTPASTPVSGSGSTASPVANAGGATTTSAGLRSVRSSTSAVVFALGVAFFML